MSYLICLSPISECGQTVSFRNVDLYIQVGGLPFDLVKKENISLIIDRADNDDSKQHTLQESCTIFNTASVVELTKAYNHARLECSLPVNCDTILSVTPPLSFVPFRPRPFLATFPPAGKDALRRSRVCMKKNHQPKLHNVIRISLLITLYLPFEYT